MKSFVAPILIIGINPYVNVPHETLRSIFEKAGKNTSPIPVKGSIDKHPFIQTLVKYRGEWRLYLNNDMRRACNKQVGDTARFSLSFDPGERVTGMPPQLGAALLKDKHANQVFCSLAPHLQKEIKRYINNLKTDVSVEKNVRRALRFLKGEERFIGRDKPH